MCVSGGSKRKKESTTVYRYADRCNSRFSTCTTLSKEEGARGIAALLGVLWIKTQHSTTYIYV